MADIKFRNLSRFIKILCLDVSEVLLQTFYALSLVSLYMLKISTQFGVAPQSFCENQYSVQDQDQEHDITLDFITRSAFHT